MADRVLLAALPTVGPLWVYAAAAVALFLLGTALNAARLRRMAARHGRLMRLVDERTRALERAERQLEQSQREIERRVAEGIESRRESERMAAYAQMVAAVVHEVRHPIFALQAAAYVLGDHLGETSALRSQLRTLDSETRRLNDLMTDLLEFARPAVLQPALVAPEELLDEAARRFRDEGHGVPVHVEIALGTPTVVVDRAGVVQALLSLMRHTVEHTAGLSRITLAARPRRGDEGPGVRLSVADDGRGPATAEGERIFEPFVIGAGKGSGLGLALVRRLVTAHGGRVTLEPAPGRGRTFHLDFLPMPVAPAAELQDGVA